MKLTAFQIKLIRGDIRQSGVEFRELEDDILDHLCCVLEEQPDTALPFEDSYRETREALFPDGYKEIQQKTSYLLSLKYGKMKKTMNTLGMAGSLILLIGAVLKILRLPGAAMLLAIGTLILIFGYLAIMMILALKNTDAWIGRFRAISGFIGASLIILGISMRIFHWPSAPVLAGGFLIFGLIFIPLYLKSIEGEKGLKFNTSSIAILLLMVITMFFSTNAIRVSNQFTEPLAELTLDLNRTYIQKHQRVQGVISSETEELLSYIEGMKCYLLDQVNPQGNNQEMSRYQVMEFSPLIDEMMSGKGDHPYDGENLEELLKSWKQRMAGVNPELAASIPEIHNEYFVNKPLYHVYSRLSKIQLDIVDLEFEAASGS